MAREPVQRRVWRIHRAGSLDRLRLEAEALPPPAPGEARVAVEAVGLNFADVFACLGLYSATPRGPFVPGLEFAGVVEAIGPPAQGDGREATSEPPLRSGDRVFGVTRFGGYATALNADVRLLQHVPAGWSVEGAAAYPVQALTAWYGLVDLGALEGGDAVLLHSAAGGVGLNALAILRAHDAAVVATVGSAAKRAFLVERYGLPEDCVIVRDPARFGAQLDRALAAMGRTGFDLVFDAVAGPYFMPALDRLAPEGRLVVYGAADFMPPGTRPGRLRLAWQYLRRPRVDPLRLMSSNRSVMAFNLIWLWHRADRFRAAFEALNRVVTTPPLVGRAFPFEAAPEAMRHLQSGASVGKVVLVYSPGA